jgi:large subunit ribosomal protein L15
MLDRLTPDPGSRRRPKRVGRGPGSTVGKTAGRGIKGQGHRSAGEEVPLYFEGGQNSLVRRIPKRGFTNIHAVPVAAVNLRDLARLGDGATVDLAELISKRLVRPGSTIVKVLAEGESPKNLTLKVHRVSKAAREKIEAAGGSIELVAIPSKNSKKATKTKESSA